MSDVKYNIAQIMSEVFGVNSPIYIPNQPKPTPELDYTGVELMTPHYKAEATSWMGTPILFTSTFQEGYYKRYKANGSLERVRLESFGLPPATMMQFSRAKNIKRTDLLGSNGTVKEIYGFDDWLIDVKGLCLDQRDSSAKAQLEKLLEWEKIADAIEIDGELFDWLDVARVAIADLKFNNVQGKPGMIQYTMRWIADEPIELEL